MTSKRTFHRTLLTVEILSEEPYDTIDLKAVAHDITYGNYSGLVWREKQEELTGAEMADALLTQGADPEFFSLTDEGDDRDDDDEDEPVEYPYIRAWCQFLYSADWYIDAQIEKARATNAPQTAIYQNNITDEWITVDAIVNQETREIVESFAARIQNR